MKKQKQDLLKKELGLLDDAAKILTYSHHRCRKIGRKSEYTLEELDHLEGLTSRFARLSDILIQKIFRLIDELDLDQPGTVRDRINRAEKKGLIVSTAIFVDIRDLRNDIAHEYLPSELNNMYQQVREWTPALLDSVQRVKNYCQKYL